MLFGPDRHPLALDDPVTDVLLQEAKATVLGEARDHAEGLAPPRRVLTLLGRPGRHGALAAGSG